MDKSEKLKKMELVHLLSTYKMIIPQEVERKIRLLCREICNVEWSGVLFYKVSGTFEDESLVITCVDLYLMDEGSTAYTEYNMSPDVSGYIVDHPELMGENIYQGLIHSHNSMPSFFSGTDTSTLLQEGSDLNHFVSLIVNNAGKYTAGITRKVKVNQTINEKFSYLTWNNELKEGERTFTIEKEYIQWFNLDIEIEEVSNNFEKEIFNRIKEIRENKTIRSNNKFISERILERSPICETPEIPKSPNSVFTDKEETGQLPLFNDNDNTDIAIDYDRFKFKDNIVDWVVKQTITCSLIIPNLKNHDISKWIEHMDSLYSKRFSCKKEFENFAANFVDFIVCFTEDPELSAFVDSTEMSAILAYQVKEKLSKLPKNEWLDIWIELYDDYIF